jgi:hypothetical protein
MPQPPEDPAVYDFALAEVEEAHARIGTVLAQPVMLGDAIQTLIDVEEHLREAKRLMRGKD